METYNILIVCTNCTAQNSINIPKGTTIADFKKDNDPLCANCGCSITPKAEPSV